MESVQGFGGIFFRAKDPKALGEWYAKNLGLPVSPYGFAKVSSKDAPQTDPYVLWTPFKADTTHFPGPLMINFRVGNLDAMLAQLRAAGVTVEDKVDESDFGKFGWCFDPEGNKIELWQPPA